MVNLSSAMGKKFAEEAEQITEKIRELGSSPLRGSLIEENVSTEV